MRGPLVCALLAFGVSPIAAAQTPIPIRDNSFLIEEAYNQEWGVVQHVGTFRRVRGSSGWGATFTQEWPAPSERHQLSYTVPLDHTAAGDDFHTGVGDIGLNYRYQVPMRTASAIAIAPRLSLLLPVGNEERDQGSGGPGAEVNFPVSIELSRFIVTHFNAGGAWTPSARSAAGDRATTVDIFVGQSLIALVHPKLNLMLEVLWTQDQIIEGADRTAHERALVVAPGIRGAIDFASGLQVVPGIAVPFSVGQSERETGIFLYLSFEHPFRRR